MTVRHTCVSSHTHRDSQPISAFMRLRISTGTLRETRFCFFEYQDSSTRKKRKPCLSQRAGDSTAHLCFQHRERDSGTVRQTRGYTVRVFLLFLFFLSRTSRKLLTRQKRGVLVLNLSSIYSDEFVDLVLYLSSIYSARQSSIDRFCIDGQIDTNYLSTLLSTMYLSTLLSTMYLRLNGQIDTNYSSTSLSTMYLRLNAQFLY